MRSRERVNWDFVHGWIEKAQADLNAALILLEGLSENYEIVGFHAQQAAEKFLKAFLARHQVELRKTHDLAELLTLVDTVDAELAQALRETETLTPYATAFRYPGDRKATDRATAQRLVDLSERVQALVTEKLAPWLAAGPPQ